MPPVDYAGPVENWTVRKPVVSSPRGIVTSQHYLASEVGAAVLADGGNAIDAVVAAGLAIGTVEPWMSGLGGGGFMVIRLAASGETWCVEFGMRAPRGLDPSAYPLASAGVDDNLFGWPSVVEDRNVLGPLSIAVPGHVAGHALALERFGTLPWRDAIAPAVALSRNGMAVDWYATLKIASEAVSLARYPESAATYLPGGLPPSGTWGGPIPRIRLGRLAETYERLQQAGPSDFYRGAIAADVVADARAAGSTLAAEDLASYGASVHRAATLSYRDARVHAAPGLSAGPTLHHALELLGPRLDARDAPDAAAYLAYTRCLNEAYSRRLELLGDDGEDAHESCTTHMSAVDAEGNVVALTQTLLSVFGSKVMLPRTGVLMNNGIMWFDPRPGRPNSMRPGRRPLSNMCPAILERADGRVFGLGASGGRRIMPAVFQLLSFLVDYGLDLDEAVHLGRIDASTAPHVLVDSRLPLDVADTLAAEFPVLRAPNAVMPALFACPNVAEFDPSAGLARGGAYVPSPWAAARAPG